jgi:hypothetical protein
MGLYEDLIAQGWTENQLAFYYPELKPGDTTWTPAVSAEERSYQESMAAFERGYQLSLYGGQDTEYLKQLYLQEHPEYFLDINRAQTEIGIPSEASFVESYPEYATGTKYEEYGTTAPQLAAAAAAEQQAQDVYAAAEARVSGGNGYAPSGDWGDMLAMGIVAVVGFSALGMLLGRK